MSEFDYRNISLQIDYIPLTFRMIFDCPSIPTQSKNNFLVDYYLKYVNDKNFKDNEYGKYIVFVDQEFYGTFYEDDIDNISDPNNSKILFEITNEIKVISKLHHIRCSRTYSLKGHNFVRCTFSFEQDFSEENEISSDTYMIDNGNTLTELNIEKYIDYSNLRFISKSPPIISQFLDLIRWREYIPVETSNGVVFRLKITLKQYIYVRIDTSDFVPFKIFTCGIPVSNIAGTICYPGRYFIPRKNEEKLYYLLGTNVSFKFIHISIPIKQTNEHESRKGIEKKQVIDTFIWKRFKLI